MTIDRTAVKSGARRLRRDRQSRPEWASGLRRLYDTVLEEPLPEAFAKLLEDLDKADER